MQSEALEEGEIMDVASEDLETPKSKRARQREIELRRYQKPDEKTVPRWEWARRDAEVAELKRLYPRLPEFYLLLAWNMHYRMDDTALRELLNSCDEEERLGCLKAVSNDVEVK